MDKERGLAAMARAHDNFWIGVTDALFFVVGWVSWLWRCAQHYFQLRYVLKQYGKLIFNIAQLRLRRCYWKLWLRWHGVLPDERSSNVSAQARRKASPGADG